MLNCGEWSHQVAISQMLQQKCFDSLLSSDALTLSFLFSREKEDISGDSVTIQTLNPAMNILKLSLTANKLSLQFLPLPFTSGLPPLSRSSSIPHCSLGKRSLRKIIKFLFIPYSFSAPVGICLPVWLMCCNESALCHTHAYHPINQWEEMLSMVSANKHSEGSLHQRTTVACYFPYRLL